VAELRELLSWRRGDAVILAEANVERDELVQYFGGGDRLPMLFNFLLNQRMFLALARGDAAPILAARAQRHSHAHAVVPRRQCRLLRCRPRRPVPTRHQWR